MPIFFDTSKKRKLYFRGGTALFLFVLLAGVLLFLFGLSYAAAGRIPITYQSAAEQYHYYYSAANDNKIAITIDDGPYPPATEGFLQTLSAEHVPATFFFIGERAFARPDLVEQASELGFDVEDHSFTHSENVQTSYGRLAAELHSTGYILSLITGKKPVYYRPPYLLGIGIDPTVNPYIPLDSGVVWSLAAGYLPVGSDINPQDWLATSSAQIISNIADELQARPNAHILLLHEEVVTSKSIGDIVAYLHGRGFTIVPLSELLTPPSHVALAATLKPGDTDKTTAGAVSQLQWFLYKQKYLDPYALTGTMDEQTVAALTNFQMHKGIVDKINPNPAVAGMTGTSTRAAIAAVNLGTGNAAVAMAPSTSLFGAAEGMVVAFFRDAYILLYPIFVAVLKSLTIFSLVLVLARSLGLVGLILWGKLYKKQKNPIAQGLSLAEPQGVSVLIPAYNEEENIAATVESVIRSSYAKREIIVLDDGSKDDTAGEVQAVIDAYPADEVRMIRLQNGGKAAALNVGLKFAKYDIVVVVDADAVLERDALGHFVKHFADPTVGAVAGKVGTTGSLRALDIFQTLEYSIGQNIDKRAFSQIGAVGIVPGPAGAWRRKDVIALGGFSTDTLAEDQDMTLTVLRSGRRVVYEPEAIAFTETPHTVKNFLTQRFRWVYGTMQCFWKHKRVFIEQPTNVMSLVVLPNVFLYNILLPLAYPFTDMALLFGLVFGELRSLVIPFLLFTTFDMCYALWGVYKEPGSWRLLVAVPLQRVVYRQLLYFSVIRGIVRVFEGTGAGWKKFAKTGETKRFYVFDMLVPVPSLNSDEVAAAAAPLQNKIIQEEGVMSLSVLPAQDQNGGDIQNNLAWSKNIL